MCQDFLGVVFTPGFSVSIFCTLRRYRAIAWSTVVFGYVPKGKNLAKHYSLYKLL